MTMKYNKLCRDRSQTMLSPGHASFMSIWDSTSRVKASTRVSFSRSLASARLLSSAYQAEMLLSSDNVWSNMLCFFSRLSCSSLHLFFWSLISCFDWIIFTFSHLFSPINSCMIDDIFYLLCVSVIGRKDPSHEAGVDEGYASP